MRPVDPRVGLCASCTASRPNGAGPFYKQTAGTHHSCLRRGGVHGRPCLEPAADANTLCGICSMKTTLCRGVNTQFCPNRREDGSDLCSSCLRPRCKRAACAGTALEDGYCESHKTVALTHLLDDQDRLASYYDLKEPSSVRGPREYICKLCNKLATPQHVQSSQHGRKLLDYKNMRKVGEKRVSQYLSSQANAESFVAYKGCTIGLPHPHQCYPFGVVYSPPPGLEHQSVQSSSASFGLESQRNTMLGTASSSLASTCESLQEKNKVRLCRLYQKLERQGYLCSNQLAELHEQAAAPPGQWECRTSQA